MPGSPKNLRILALLVFLFLFSALTHNAAAMTVAVDPSVPSPAPVGTLVTFDPTVSDAASGTLWYRYRVSPDGVNFRVVRDYGPATSLEWTASEHEGTYQIEVSVQNRDTGDLASAAVSFQMTSRVAGNQPVISPTANLLVFLYSAPPCPSGSMMQVKLVSAANTFETSSKACQDSLSMNFYLAGMRSGVTYVVQHLVTEGTQVSFGPTLQLAIPAISLPITGDPLRIPNYNLLELPKAQDPDGVLLQATLIDDTVATDLYGNLLWYYPGQISYLTRPEPGGRFFGVWDAFGSDPSYSYLREFDLAGTTIRETNAARVSAQLQAAGMRSIGSFHHEVRALAGGKVLVLASAEQLMTDVQGPGTVDVLGDVILVLDEDLQLDWAWDSFQHLDWTRMATLGETCSAQAAGCPPFYLASVANDWLHGNCLQRTADGNILYSMRHQDWVIKIDYQDGAGTGNILWRLGNGGDFQIISDDPSPWFSHQHDPEFEKRSTSVLTLFDNGDVRHAADSNANSRGQVLELDAPHMTATLVFNVDFGEYSLALGSAHKLPNGNYHFDVGDLLVSSQSVEIDPSGHLAYGISIGSISYRSFRMRDLYTPETEDPGDGAANQGKTMPQQ
jgi:hypothetical protein